MPHRSYIMFELQVGKTVYCAETATQAYIKYIMYYAKDRPEIRGLRGGGGWQSGEDVSVLTNRAGLQTTNIQATNSPKEGLRSAV